MARERCPECGHPDLQRIGGDDRVKHGLDANPAKEYARCMGCEVYLIRPAGTALEWHRRMNCIANASDVAAQLNKLGQTHRGVTNIRVCNNGCFNLEGFVIQPPGSRSTTESGGDELWFEVGTNFSYRPSDVLDRFPDAWPECPGLSVKPD